MKIDELYNETSVDISVLKSDMNMSDCPLEHINVKQDSNKVSA